MNPAERILVTEPEGMVGAALVRRLRAEGFNRLVLPSGDLGSQAYVDRLFQEEKPTRVFLAAGPSGGIAENRRAPADLLHANLLVQAHVLHAAWRAGVQRLVYLASACVYPRLCPQPMREDALWSGPLEPTSSAYATAKLAGIEACLAYNRQHGTRFVPAIPTNLYGPGDDFDPERAHVCAALMARMRAAGSDALDVWGTGEPRREFLYVDDLADACLFLMRCPDPPMPVNIASGETVSIRELVALLREATGFRGEVRFDASKPDGAPLKTLDGSRLAALGWKPTVPLAEGLRRTWGWYRQRP